VDSKIPNLALMKLSAHHKKQGDEVFLNATNTYDKVYLSCIFEKNKSKALGMALMYNNVEVGGYAVSNVRLPENIEHIMPDYSLYNCDYSIGFTTRGCIRNCPWCIVPKQEGKIRKNCDIYEFWNPEHKRIVLFDNNILALPSHFKRVSEQVQKEKLSVDFNQGLDVRLLTDEFAEILSQLKLTGGEPRFAFDSLAVENEVVRGIETLQKHGIKRAKWYVLVGFNTTKEEDLYRLHLLKKYNQTPYVMRYKTTWGNRDYADIASWANQTRFFRKMSFERFVECRRHRGLVSQFKQSEVTMPIPPAPKEAGILGTFL